MPKYTKTEFAAIFKQESNYLSVMIKRGKVVVGEDGLIDTEDEVNSFYLSKRLLKAGILNLEGATINKRKGDDSDIPEYVESEKKLKYFDTIKRDEEIKKLRLEIAKKTGEVIPSGLIGPMITRHNHAIIMAQKNADEEMLQELGKLYDMNANDIARIRGEWVSRRNKSVDDATIASIAALDGIIMEYSAQRGVGERN